MERWLVVGTAITLLGGAFGFAMLPFTGMTNEWTLYVVYLWVLVMAGVACFYLLWETTKLAAEGEKRPLTVLRSQFGWKRVAVVFLGCCLLGLNLSFFGLVKPQLGLITPFTADKLLADFDHLIFGTDPWRLLTWVGHPGMAFIYHQGWFLFLAFVLFYLLIQPPSLEKNRALISYLLMWSLIGPAVHLLLPAAGPVFYEELGHGARFAEIPQSVESRVTELYLWRGLAHREFNAAGGISAMPSLHLATMFWAMIVLRQRKWWFVFATAFTLYIFLGSIALGWHYAVDGVAGGVVALFAYWLASPRSVANYLQEARRRAAAVA